MSLSTGLNTATNGLSVIEQKIALTSNNITQANTAGYTEKTYNANYENVGDSTIDIGGAVQGSLDPFLTQSAVAQNSDAQQKLVTSNYLAQYDSAIGTTGTGTTISSSVDDFLAGLTSLDGSSDVASAKESAVSAASTLASQLNTASASVQSLRLQANQQIGTSVTTINDTLDQLQSLNAQIAKSTDNDEGTANLEDQRATALQTLSQQIGIQYFYDSSNQVHIYSGSGQELLGANANHLSYTPVSSVSSSTVYPGGFPAITVDGTDITSTTSTGALGGLITLRDTTLPGEQGKLDALANTLKSSTNAALNQGAALPPRNTLTGSATTSATSAFSGTGTVRIAVTDSNGVVQSYSDLNLASYGTVGALEAAIGGIGGVSASINANGNLVIAATTSGDGISINESTSAVGANSQGFSDYFGLNNLFDGTSGASDIAVSSYLTQTPGALATGTLSNSATLAVGQSGISSGDTSLIASLSTTLGNNLSFPAGGSFSAQNNTLSGYANAIIASVATLTSSAKSASDTSQSVLSTLNTTIANQTGVNIDQETANATVLQNSYSATAQIISTIRSMFQSLISAIQ